MSGGHGGIGPSAESLPSGGAARSFPRRSGCGRRGPNRGRPWSRRPVRAFRTSRARRHRSEEHTSELQSLMRISYAVFCLKKKKKNKKHKRSIRDQLRNVIILQIQIVNTNVVSIERLT